MVDETRFASSVAVSHGHPFKALRLFGFSNHVPRKLPLEQLFVMLDGSSLTTDGQNTSR